ncbi:DUF4169 family protein [Notoacmeibacter sp. MSK16QG-6]|uniref:DUF4169 family protein n=1 Tax=Notoacmeibacter sp. MSK16QG-6 TaxID=2957982 RepID=UPI00209F83B1|nr:DUF4169 family protein [Notoacmeibacter sp. MSK16QG-6]MCP1199659.1 DUF4169 family protein [Notoacmeibacter sp. MSK16QG-6]
MGEIVNLRRHRKRQARDGDAEKAAENRHRHGRTSAQKKQSQLLIEREERHLDGHRLDK